MTTNPHLLSLREELTLLSQQGALDGYGHYLLGVILKELDLTAQAAGMFVLAARQEPMHWGAWLELASLCVDEGDVPRVRRRGRVELVATPSFLPSSLPSSLPPFLLLNRSLDLRPTLRSTSLPPLPLFFAPFLLFLCMSLCRPSLVRG